MSSWGFAIGPAHNMTSFLAKQENVRSSLRLWKKTPSTFGFLPVWWDTERRETRVLGQILKWALRSTATGWGRNARMVLWRSPDALVVRSIVAIPTAGSLGELISAMWGSPIRSAAWYALEPASIIRFMEENQRSLCMRFEGKLIDRLVHPESCMQAKMSLSRVTALDKQTFFPSKLRFRFVQRSFGFCKQRFEFVVAPIRMAHFLPLIVITYTTGVGAGINPWAAAQTFTDDCIQLPVIGVDDRGAVVYSTECILGIHIGRKERNSGGPSVTDSTTFDDKDRNIWILAEPSRKAASSGTAYEKHLVRAEYGKLDDPTSNDDVVEDSIGYVVWFELRVSVEWPHFVENNVWFQERALKYSNMGGFIAWLLLRSKLRY